MATMVDRPIELATEYLARENEEALDLAAKKAPIDGEIGAVVGLFKEAKQREDRTPYGQRSLPS